MPDKAWKAFERRMAPRFPNGKRRGADFGGGAKGGGKSDIICDGWAPELKLLGAPTYGAMLAACKQAERNAAPSQIPIAIVKRKNAEDKDALVVMRFAEFEQWYLPGNPEP